MKDATPRRRAVVAVLVVAGLLLVGAASLLSIVSRSSRSVAGSPGTGGEALLGFASRAVEADLNRDGTLDFVMSCWEHGAHDPSLRLCAVDGATFRVLWRTAALSPDNTTVSREWEVLTDRLIAVDTRSGIHAYDLASGTEVDSFALPAPVEEPVLAMCTWSDDDGKLWMDRGMRGMLLDLKSRREEMAPAPRACLERLCAVSHRPLASDCAALGVLPPPETGYRVVRLLSDGRQSLAEVDTPEGRVLQAVVAGPTGTAKVVWARRLPADAGKAKPGSSRAPQLAAGRVVLAEAASDGGFQLVAVDVVTGGVVWSSPPEDVRRFWLSEHRVYVSTAKGLDVLDAPTGRRIHRETITSP